MVLQNSHPTYEELKHIYRGLSPFQSHDSHPTYEELKQLPRDNLVLDKRNSHPTYEELKQYMARNNQAGNR